MATEKIVSPQENEGARWFSMMETSLPELDEEAEKSDAAICSPNLPVVNMST